MSISFNHFPASWRLPLVWIEVDPSQAGTVTQRQPAILIGQKFATGTATSNMPVAVADLATAKKMFGEGSMLERMANAFFNNNAAALLYFMPLDEPSVGTVATGTITVSAPPSGSGVLALYIAGQRIQIGVIGTESASVMATNIVAAINALPTLPVTATASGATITLTCRWKGSTGNDILIGTNYYGTFGGETTPIGLAVTGGTMAGGAGAPDLTNAIAALGDDIYDYVACPFSDTISLNALGTEYGFGDTGRWGWMRQLYGSVFAARRDTYANLMTWGATGNDPVTSVMAVEATSPSPVWEWAAAYTAQAARALLNDPARPLQTLELQGVLPALKGFRFIKAQLNNLASTGMAVAQVSPNGNPMIMVEASRYQQNIYGQGDTAYFVITTLHTLAAIFRRLTSAITNKYPRSKLANDGTRFGPGQAIITPSVAKAELVAEYAAMEYDGLVENMNAFKSTLIVERDDNNPNRLSVLYPPDVINQLRTFAVLAQFRLQYSTINQSAAA